MISIAKINLMFVFLTSVIFFGCDRISDYAEPDNYLPPGIPENLTIIAAHDGFIQLKWNRNQEPNFYRYILSRSVGDSLNFKIIAVLNDTFFEDDSLEYTTKYFYKLAAEDRFGKLSNYSHFVSDSPLNLNKPDKPRALTINARNWEEGEYIHLEWKSFYDVDINHYDVFRSSIPGFIPDSLTFIDRTSKLFYNDSISIKIYNRYFYKIIAVDKGNLISEISSEVSDMLLPEVTVLAPNDSVSINNLSEVSVASLSVDALYRISILENKYFGEVYTNSVFATSTNEPIKIPFSTYSLDYGKEYYFRIITYTDGGTNANSISKLYRFVLGY